MVAPRMKPRLHAACVEGSPCPKERDLGLLGEGPEGAEIGKTRAAVIQYDGRTHQEATHQKVPHHPACCTEPKEAVPGPEIMLQGEQFHMLEHNPAVTLHHRLRQTGSARRKQHPERLLEGKRHAL